MRLRSIFIVASALLVNSLTIAQEQVIATQTKKFESPDGMLVAVVSSSKVLEATIESRIEIRTSNGKNVLKRDYSSSDGEHGFGVKKALWTPDSQFFLYSLESSGGHSGWHFPIDIFSRRRGRIFRLDDALNDAVTDPDFGVAAPDRITVQVLSDKRTRRVSLVKLPLR